MATGQLDLYREAPEWWEGLTGRRRAFVELYCTDAECLLNASAAYRKAYNASGAAARKHAQRLTRDPKIHHAITQLLKSRRREEDDQNTEKLLDKLALLSFYNPAEIITAGGRLRVKDLKELGPLAYCVEGIKRGPNGSLEVKLADRVAAMKMLAEYLKLVRQEPADVVNAPVFVLPLEREAEAIETGNTRLVEEEGPA